MRIYLLLLSMVCCLFSCKNKTTEQTDQTQTATVDAVRSDSSLFFPVTAYISGQIFDITNRGINPVKVTTVNEKVIDSSWVKAEELNTVFSEFLTPLIDSNNLTHLYSQSKFRDQTLNAYTFTYEPSSALPDSIDLQSWNVHIDPASNRVRSVYMVKQRGDKKLLLTWKSDKSALILTLATDPKGNSKLIKEERINWDF